jgi:uncharacterized membrane protein YeaQ/YmgE (transglycosylase-associated protein family)
VGILLWILFGVVAGSVARRVMPGPSAGGIGAAILAGIVGGLVGGFLGTISAGETSPAFDVRSLLMAMSGTLFLLFGYRCFAMRTAF